MNEYQKDLVARLGLSCSRAHCNCTNAQAAREIQTLAARAETLSQTITGIAEEFQKARFELRAMTTERDDARARLEIAEAELEYSKLSLKKMTDVRAFVEATAEKAISELESLADQKPVAWVMPGGYKSLLSGCGHTVDCFGAPNKNRIHPLYARPIPSIPSVLRRDATRVLAAWDGTVLPKSHDGRLQQEMECLRESLKAEHTPIPPDWIAAVTFARDIFLNYADLHRGKCTQDGDEKALANQSHADMLTKLLERAK